MQTQLDLVAQLAVRGLITGSVYALLGVSWGIIYNTTRTFHICPWLRLYACRVYQASSARGRACPPCFRSLPGLWPRCSWE